MFTGASRVTCRFVAVGMVVALSGCGFRSRPVTDRTVTVTKPGILLGHYPTIGLNSTRPQINAFVAYFTAKGFPSADLRANYYPSGRVKTFHYHASHLGSIVTVDLDKPHGINSISTLEGGGSTTVNSFVTYGIQ